MLEQAGDYCLRAYPGTEALLCLEHARSDLILLDLMLSGLSGEELLGKIQGIPVIVVSAFQIPEPIFTVRLQFLNYPGQQILAVVRF